MNRVEVVARMVKRKLGLGDNSPITNAVRPAYDLLLRTLYSRTGLPRTLICGEAVRLHPIARHYRDDFEPQVVSCLQQEISPGAAVLEIGAGIGILTILMARWAGPQGRVYAFEPTALTRDILLQNLVLNGVADRVTIVGEAISDSRGTADFFVEKTAGLNTLSAIHGSIPHARRVQVPVTTIDDFCEENSIAPDLIKIDIEGYECHALRGAKRTLVRYNPVLVVEVHPMNWSEIGVEPESFPSLLEDLQYRATALENQQFLFTDYGHLVLKPVAPPS